MQIIYKIVQHINTPEVEILVQGFAAHDAAFMSHLRNKGGA